MWYGMYSYGHLGGVWTDNLMHGTSAQSLDLRGWLVAYPFSQMCNFLNDFSVIIDRFLPLLVSPVSDRVVLFCSRSWADNHIYGFDPHDDSDFITIQGNTVWNNGENGRASMLFGIEERRDMANQMVFSSYEVRWLFVVKNCTMLLLRWIPFSPYKKTPFCCNFLSLLFRFFGYFRSGNCCVTLLPCARLQTVRGSRDHCLQTV